MSINWNGLLRWSLRQAEDGGPTTDLPRRSPEDLKFLEQAIKAYYETAPNPYKVLEEVVDVLEASVAHVRAMEGMESIEDPCNASWESTSQKEKIDLTGLSDTEWEEKLNSYLAVFQQLLDDHPELSRDLGRVHCIRPLLRVLYLRTYISPPIIVLALQILSFALQNNPAIQEEVANLNGLKILFPMVESKEMVSDPSHPQLALRALGAIGSLIRHHRSSELEYVESGGVDVLVSCMKTDDCRLQEKAAQLLIHLFVEDFITFEKVKKHGVVNGVCYLLGNRDIRVSGVSFGEITAELTTFLIRRFRPLLSKNGDLQTLKKSVKGRIDYLATLEFQNYDQDDISGEKEILTSCYDLADYPGMKLTCE